MEPTHLPMIVRAFSGRRGHYARAEVEEQWTRTVLILDTETTTDPTQRLLFGSYRYAGWEDDGSLARKGEGLFHADDLSEIDPNGLATLRDYASSRGLPLYDRREFVEHIFWRAAYQVGAMVVGFNLPFDLSRLAIGHGAARKRNRGGFSFVLWDYWDKPSQAWKENHYRPRVVIKHRNSTSAFIEFGSCNGVPKKSQTRGRFLDLRTLTHALTDKAYTLGAACVAFGIEHGKGTAEDHGRIDEPYIDYNRQDVKATAELLEAARREFERYPVSLDPCKALSTASIAKACLRTMGIGSPMQRFKNVPDLIHGRSMTAYYGGRAEARIRRTAVPVVTTDFLSMYPTVNSLLGLWPYIIAHRISVADFTAEAQGLLARVDLKHCFDPAAWCEFGFLAEVEPHDDILPVRARYNGHNTNIGVNVLTADRPMWYAGPDLIASTLLTGRAPKILRAVRLNASGRAEGLRRIDLGFGVSIEPAKEDFFRRVIELRKSLHKLGLESREEERLGRALKIIANSGSYGVFAEMQPRPRGTSEPFLVHGLEAFRSNSAKQETPGEFSFPFFAAMTTAGARLMLAMLERSVTDIGGTYAFCDTDSMAIVATPRGGPIDVAGEFLRALSWSDVERIRLRFADLNPYDRTAVPGSILNIEGENFESGQQRQLFAFVISAKRDVLLP